MRLDKFIQASRIIKRRSIAKAICDSGKVLVNQQKAKPSKELKIGDILTIDLGKQLIRCQVLSIPNSVVRREEATSLYKIISQGDPAGRPYDYDPHGGTMAQ